MTISTWLKSATACLTEAGITTARLDSLVLLEDVVSKNRAWILAHDDTELTATQITQLTKLLTLCSGHTPLAYIRGKAEFYGRTFVITSDVLVPRPESEAMIDLLKSIVAARSNYLPTNEKVRIADVGAGSGALGVTAALEVKNSQVELLGIDPAALKTAKMNVDLFTLTISTMESDLLDASTQSNHILLCNLPYVPDEYEINQAASHEPKLALFAGTDGLDLYRKLFNQIQKLSEQPLYILTESLPMQHAALQHIAGSYGYSLRKTDDFIQLFCLQK